MKFCDLLKTDKNGVRFSMCIFVKVKTTVDEYILKYKIGWEKLTHLIPCVVLDS